MLVSLQVHVGEGVFYPPSSSGCVRLLAMKLRAGGAGDFGFLPALQTSCAGVLGRQAELGQEGGPRPALIACPATGCARVLLACAISS